MSHRTHRNSLLLSFLITLAVYLSFLSSIIAAEVGFAQVDVTPPAGVPMAGYYSARYSEGTHDPLYAKTMVVRVDNKIAALVSLDLIGTNKALVSKVRELVSGSGLMPAAVMISATHAHTGPVMVLQGRDSITDPAAAEKLRIYLTDLPSMVAASIRQAIENLQPAKIYTATGNCPDLAFNRRFFMTDGSVGWNAGKLNPQIIRPVGPTDDSVPIVYVTDLDDRPLGAYVNFAMHLDTVGGPLMSADYPFVLAEMLKRWKGEEFCTLFTIGCAGDINHLNVKWDHPQKGIEEATRIGTVLAGSTMQALVNLTPVDADSLSFENRMVPLRTPAITDGDIASAEQVLEQLRTDERVPFLQQVEAFKVLDVKESGGQIKGEVQVIRLGPDLAWVALPGEIFVELGLDLKNASPAKHTIIAELAGGSIGYVPTRRAYREGNYEVISARVGEGSGEIMVEAALDLLSEMSIVK